MAYKRRFDTSSAYGQLIILVFLPICLLAAVGGILVFYETMRASNSEQEALAEAVLMRYKPMVIELIPSLLEQQRQQTAFDEKNAQKLIDDIESVNQNKSASILSADQPILSVPADQSLTDIRADSSNTTIAMASIRDKLSDIQSEQHVQRVAIVNQDNKVLATVGYGVNEEWPKIDASQGFLSKQATAVGTAYGSILGEVTNQRLWLLIDMDNEPLYIARYRIAMALAITGLFTILILLLSLNIYAKRWIAPIYELRLQLQRTNVDNLYKPIPVESNGELNLLQQDLVRTLRRLHSSFQELKNHSEQTEDDLRLAFDEMEMQNISIRTARDVAISASQAKSAFLANISHELRTPLNSIDGFINLLARHGELSSEQDLYVQTIRKSSAHLLALVNDVLDFSKIEAGKLVLDRHEFDLYDTIYDVVDMLSPVSAEKGLRTAVLFYNDVPMRINGDALRLKQILTNIVGNAIKFTDSGGVVVRVSLDDYQDNYLMISVQDSGKGISATDQKMLFQSFSQGDPSITRQYGGTGLGLVISKQLTRLMGGDIGFYDNSDENIDKQGATFWFRMPAHVDVLTAQTGQTISLPKLQALASTTDEYNVLVWINHNASRQVLRASLQSLPIKLTQANSLPGVLESLKEQGNHWDWVIVDNDTQDDMMALLKQIRLHYQGKLAVFGYQIAADQALLNRYHANILYEPLDKRQLYAMLDTQKSVMPAKVQLPIWHGVTVLAVDDHLPNLLVLDALLSELGISVITASSGFEAIEIITKHQDKRDDTAKSFQQSLSKKTQIAKAEVRAQVNNMAAPMATSVNIGDEDKRHIDLIFMDIQMPRMSGREAAVQIRQIENSDTRIPIIALTAHSLSDERDKLLASGIDDYVGKPISQPQLLQVLQKWLGRADTIETQIPEVANNKAALAAADPSLPLGQALNNQMLSNDTGSDINNSQRRQVARNTDIDTSMATSARETVQQANNKMAQPLTLKKIRDDYLRDNQLYNNYLLENQRRPDGETVFEITPESMIESASELELDILDWEDALIRSANKPDLAAKLIIMMLDTIADEKEALARAWQARDRYELAQIAHRILGASRYTGVPQLRQTSQNLEDKCLLNLQHTTPAQFAMLKPYFEALMLALTHLQTLDLSAYTQLNYHRLNENDMNWKMI